MKVKIVSIPLNSFGLTPGMELEISEDYIHQDDQGTFLKLLDPELKKFLRVNVECM